MNIKIDNKKPFAEYPTTVQPEFAKFKETFRILMTAV